MSMDEKLKMLQTYFNLMTMNGGTFVFQTAFKMGLLKPLMMGKPLTAQEIASQCELHPEGTELVLDTLVALNLLEKNNQQFQLAPVTSLLSGTYENLSTDYWEHLPVLLKTGQPYKKMDSLEHSEQEYQQQAKSLEWMMTPSAMYLAQMVKSMASDLKGAKVLDIGAGSGVWSLNLIQTLPESEATLLDWPSVLAVAKASAQEKSLSERVNYIEGNYHQSEIPASEFNFCTMGNVSHIETEDGNKKLFSKIYQGLKPGGQLFVIDVYGENPQGELAKALYKLGLCIRTENGKVHSPENLSHWLSEIGYQNIQLKNIDMTPFTMGVVVASK